MLEHVLGLLQANVLVLDSNTDLIVLNLMNEPEGSLELLGSYLKDFKAMLRLIHTWKDSARLSC